MYFCVRLLLLGLKLGQKNAREKLRKVQPKRRPIHKVNTLPLVPLLYKVIQRRRILLTKYWDVEFRTSLSILFLRGLLFIYLFFMFAIGFMVVILSVFPPPPPPLPLNIYFFISLFAETSDILLYYIAGHSSTTWWARGCARNFCFLLLNFLRCIGYFGTFCLS